LTDELAGLMLALSVNRSRQPLGRAPERVLELGPHS
jgi:hypothetical protein